MSGEQPSDLPFHSTEGELSDIEDPESSSQVSRFSIVTYHQRCNNHLRYDKAYGGFIKSYGIISNSNDVAESTFNYYFVGSDVDGWLQSQSRRPT
jgi:hypothetical protein